MDSLELGKRTFGGISNGHGSLATEGSASGAASHSNGDSADTFEAYSGGSRNRMPHAAVEDRTNSPSPSSSKFRYKRSVTYDMCSATPTANRNGRSGGLWPLATASKRSGHNCNSPDSRASQPAVLATAGATSPVTPAIADAAANSTASAAVSRTIRQTLAAAAAAEAATPPPPAAKLPSAGPNDVAAAEVAVAAAIQLRLQQGRRLHQQQPAKPVVQPSPEQHATVQHHLSPEHPPTRPPLLPAIQEGLDDGSAASLPVAAAAAGCLPTAAPPMAPGTKALTGFDGFPSPFCSHSPGHGASNGADPPLASPWVRGPCGNPDDSLHSSPPFAAEHPIPHFAALGLGSVVQDSLAGFAFLGGGCSGFHGGGGGASTTVGSGGGGGGSGSTDPCHHHDDDDAG
ncbi:hypothetical protein Agub_g7509, partial [Astrephomene gubernaculifera]